ncbi:LPXTG cell wall anchor domain-containing protein [Lactobacillus sp. Marseille-P7033]|nr:LPXTG cell wall anchor domain-containing protein [Lactobacillus sp. Marseille-P7033]NGC78657.1 LPXTG cell wall anchor domain-containing protein [Limosilactobacillus reuteri]
MNMKNKLMLSGASLVAALTLGVTTVTAHAATYDELNAKWNQKMEEDNKKRLVNAPWLDLQSAAEQGDSEAQAWMKQVDGNQGSAQSQQGQNVAPQTQNANNANSANATTGATGNNSAQSNGNVQGNQGVATSNKATSTVATTQGNTVTTSTAPVKADNGVKTLPQTGNADTQAAAATGLGLATLAGMFGFGYMKKRA